MCIKFEEQFFSDKLKEIISKLCDVEFPFKDIIVSHHEIFIGLYKECKSALNHSYVSSSIGSNTVVLSF